jgi:hypothetical protein
MSVRSLPKSFCLAAALTAAAGTASYAESRLGSMSVSVEVRRSCQTRELNGAATLRCSSSGASRVLVQVGDQAPVLRTLQPVSRAAGVATLPTYPAGRVLTIQF